MRGCIHGEGSGLSDGDPAANKRAEAVQKTDPEHMTYLFIHMPIYCNTHILPGWNDISTVIRSSDWTIMQTTWHAKYSMEYDSCLVLCSLLEKCQSDAMELRVLIGFGETRCPQLDARQIVDQRPKAYMGMWRAR